MAGILCVSKKARGNPSRDLDRMRQGVRSARQGAEQPRLRQGRCRDGADLGEEEEEDRGRPGQLSFSIQAANAASRCRQARLSTRPATASSFLTRAGSRFSGAVRIAYSSAVSEPILQGGCSRGKSRATRVTKRLAFSELAFSTLRIDRMSTSPCCGCQES